MYKFIVACLLGLFVSIGWADESMHYSQKTLPNGDVETTYSSSDGSKVVSVQHKDGSSETTSHAADGTKSVVVQHKDGSVDTHIEKPDGNKN